MRIYRQWNPGMYRTTNVGEDCKRHVDCALDELCSKGSCEKIKTKKRRSNPSRYRKFGKMLGLHR